MKKQFARMFAIVAAAAILILGIAAGRFWEAGRQSSAKLDSSAITAQLRELSSLSTAELEYRGLVRYQDGDIPLLTKKAFTMIYDAHIKAGIDFSQIQVEAADQALTIRLPQAEIQDVTIASDSLEFYDEKFALFNFQDRTDTVTALQYAEEDARERAADTDLTSAADEKAQTLILGFLNSLWNAEDAPEIHFETLSSESGSGAEDAPAA